MADIKYDESLFEEVQFNEANYDQSLFEDITIKPVESSIATPTGYTSEGIPKYEDIFSKNQTLDMFKNTYDSKINAIDTNHEAKIKSLSDLGLDEEQTKVAKANIEANTSKAKEVATIEYNKSISEKNIFELLGKKSEYTPSKDTTKEASAYTQEKGLETPAVSPEFAIGGLLGKLGVSSSIAGDIGADIAVNGFDAASKYINPEFEKEHPIAYTALSLASALVGGKAGITSKDIALKSAEKASMEVGAILADPIRLTKNIIEGKASDKQAYDFLVNKTGETTQSIDKALNEYATAINKNINELTHQDKINAVLTNTQAGKSFKVQAEIYNDQTLGSLNKMEESIKNAVDNATKDGNFEIPTLQLRDYIDKSGTMFEEAKNVLLNNYNHTVKVDTKLVDQLEDTLTKSSTTSDDISMVKKIIGYLRNPNGTTVEELLTSKMDLNQLKLKSTKAFKAGQVGELLDNIVQKAVGDDVFSVWKEVNKRYATQALIKGDNPLGKLLLQSTTGTGSKSLSSNQIAEKLLTLTDKGYDTFNFVRQSLGEEATSLIEKKIVNLAFDKATDMSKAVSKIKDFEFSTVEGRQLQSEIDRLSGLISDKDAKSLMNNLLGKQTSNVGWSDDILAKVRYGIIGKVWDTITRRLPSGEQERALVTIGDAIKNNTYADDIIIKKGDIFEQAFRDEQKAMQQRIDTLIAKGTSKTIQENKELIEKTRNIKLIEDSLNTKRLEYKPKQKQEFTGNTRRVSDEQVKQVVKDIKSSQDLINTYINQLKIFSNPKKTNVSAKQRKQMIDEVNTKLKEEKAKLITLKGKLPKKY